MAAAYSYDVFCQQRKMSRGKTADARFMVLYGGSSKVTHPHRQIVTCYLLYYLLTTEEGAAIKREWSSKFRDCDWRARNGWRRSVIDLCCLRADASSAVKAAMETSAGQTNRCLSPALGRLLAACCWPERAQLFVGVCAHK